MAINLVSLIMQSLTPDMVGKIASMLGISPALAQKAVTVGVPAILGSFAGVASTPGGASQLSRTLSQSQQSGLLDQFKNASGASGQQNLADRGVALLSGLLGDDGLNKITNAVSNNAGIDTGAGKSLLGMLGTVVAGVLGQQQKISGLDADGLSSLLASQKSQIASALPQGLSSQLGGLLGGTAATAGRFGRMTEDTVTGASQAAQATAGRTSSAPLIYGLAALAALFGVGWYFLANDQTQQTAPSTVGAAPSNVTAADLTSQVRSVVGDLRTDLQNITDASSAQAALPRLQQRNDQLDRLTKLTAQLPPAAQKGLAAPVTGAMPALNQLFDRILAIPGVAALAKPTIDALRTKLDTIARA